MATPAPKAPPKRDALSTIKGYLLGDAMRESIAALIPKHLTPDTMMRTALSSIQKTPMLQQCSLASLVQCIKQSAELGLQPGGALGHAYLVPYQVKGVYQCQLIVGYRGYVHLARQSAQVRTVSVGLVRAGDVWEYSEGAELVLRHQPAWNNQREVLGGYCVARFADGFVQATVMSRWEIDKAQASSKMGDRGAWVDWWDEMAKKTVIRRAAKLWPLSPEDKMAAALELESDENTVEGSLVSRAADVLPGAVDESAEPEAPAELPAQTPTSAAREVVAAALRARATQAAPTPQTEVAPASPGPRTRIIDVEPGEDEAAAIARAEHEQAARDRA